MNIDLCNPAFYLKGGRIHMPCFISVDGGGSKLNAMMFDEDMNLLGRGLSGGVNLTQTSLEDCRENVRDVLRQLMANGTPEEIDTVYFTFVGPVSVLKEELEAVTRVNRCLNNSESFAGIMAGSLKTEGVLALSGTGSDVFYVARDRLPVVGGWGPILGDQGSGSWIGQQAARAVVRQVNGWGEETLLRQLIREEWNMKEDWDMVDIVHRSPAPFRKVASLTRVVGKAASRGDQVALDILKEAGRLMAEQTFALFRLAQLSEEQMDVTLCGGAWKTHPAMFESYLEALRERYPSATAHRPLFEHVCAGPVRHLLMEKGMPREEALALMQEKFADYRIG